MQTSIWDAWNRLVSLKEGATTIAVHRYDGFHRRVFKGTTIGGIRYYSDQWQVLEERLDSDALPDRQYVWGTRYPDDLVLRDRPGLPGSGLGSGSGEGEERLYALHDQWHVAAIVSRQGTVQERYAYRAFGQCLFLAANYSARSQSFYDWETLYGCYRYDPESKLYLARHRFLHSGLGRWLSRDPLANRMFFQHYIDFKDHEKLELLLVSLYQYVFNDPENLTDLLGLATIRDYISAGIAALSMTLQVLTGATVDVKCLRRRRRSELFKSRRCSVFSYMGPPG